MDKNYHIFYKKNGKYKNFRIYSLLVGKAKFLLRIWLYSKWTITRFIW